MHQMQDQGTFKKKLAEYWASKGITQIKIPQIGGKELNLYKLYRSVCKKGGGQAVSHNKMWKEIVDEFGLPSTCTSASFTLKNHYQKYLLGYEQKVYFGRDDSAQLPQLVAGRTRKPMASSLRISDDGPHRPIDYTNKYGERNIDTSSLSSEIKKYYQKSDPNQIVNYIKRTKMYPSMPQVKRLILGFQSTLKQETNFAINTLLLYSVNTQAPFLFMQYPHVIQSICSFIKSIYPPKDLGQMELLRSITLAIRNLAIDYRNLQPIQQSIMMDIFDKIFEDKVDREVNRNIVDIYSSLTNVGWDCTKLIDHIEDYLDKDSYEDLETGIDILKSLVEEKEEICEEIIIKKMQFFIKNLLHHEAFIREAVLQIFAYITDKSDLVRQTCVKNFKFMNRIFGLITCGYESETQSQLAGYILSNLTKKEENIDLLKKFQKQILLISFNDDSFSSITAPLLFKLSNRSEEERKEEEDKKEEQ